MKNIIQSNAVEPPDLYDKEVWHCEDCERRISENDYLVQEGLCEECYSKGICKFKNDYCSLWVENECQITGLCEFKK